MNINKHDIELYVMNDMHVKPSLKGFDYLVDAISIICDNVDAKNHMIRDIYSRIAELHDDNCLRVERAMNHALNSINYDGSVSDFICTARIMIIKN